MRTTPTPTPWKRTSSDFERLFVVRDDGVGMTYDEFVNNWLTLATDVKISGANDGSPVWVPDGKERRKTLW